jgi:hypothetical protein
MAVFGGFGIQINKLRIISPLETGTRLARKVLREGFSSAPQGPPHMSRGGPPSGKRARGAHTGSFGWKWFFGTRGRSPATSLNQILQINPRTLSARSSSLLKPTIYHHVLQPSASCRANPPTWATNTPWGTYGPLAAILCERPSADRRWLCWGSQC